MKAPTLQRLETKGERLYPTYVDLRGFKTFKKTFALGHFNPKEKAWYVIGNSQKVEGPIEDDKSLKAFREKAIGNSYRLWTYPI